MEQVDEKELKKMYVPALGERRNRKYKSLYQRTRIIAWSLFWLLTLVAYLLGMSLYGGHVLQARLEHAKTTIILPNGALTTK
jgi:hypothetical protein